ncbi:BatA domain-containing protein [Spirosoma sp. KNUC1025]|uniref:BatA domain-containing protein n=1 Tax=Spirosoma sp. KNUC1025 TaxID=2894082 RepID=UPI00386E27AA|nr:BatA domain-containing protein [Spirosoma sp. KNUC1025]
MQFIEPVLLWGALAVAIPVAIHFWHQKRGKLLPWAATQWLTESQQQQSRGLRLDNILLLIIRCLLLILLAILLAQPILNWFAKPPIIQKVHLVQPSASVANNFRFELTEAQKKENAFSGPMSAWHLSMNN